MIAKCPTCRGRGQINDPKPHGPMFYSGPDGESWPQVMCQSCGGSGWIEDNTPRKRAPVAPRSYDPDEEEARGNFASDETGSDC